MSFSVDESGSAPVVRVAENITFGNQDEFQNIWDRILATGRERAVLDLSALTYFGSLALGLVAKVAGELKQAKCHLVIVRPREDRVFQVFRITRLVEWIDFFEDEASALESLSG
jgi:anti-anti-sigma factor